LNEQLFVVRMRLTERKRTLKRLEH